MRVALRLILLTMLVLLIAACSSDEAPPPEPPTRFVPPSPTPAPPTPVPSATPTPTITPLPIPRSQATSAEEQSYVRLVHALPGGPVVDVYIDGLAVGFGLSYGVNSAATQIVGGSYTVRVLNAGVSPGLASTPLLQQAITIPVGQTSTLIVTGDVNAPRLLVVQETVEPLDTNQSRVRIIHAAPSQNAIIARSGGVDMAAPLALGDEMPAVTREAGPITISFVGDGGLAIGAYIGELRERFQYTLVVIDDPGALDQVTTLVFETRTPGRTTLRAVNITQDVPSLDVYINGEPLALAVEYSRITDRQAIASGTTTVEVLPAGTPYGSVDPIGISQFTAREEDDLTLIVMGTAQSVDIVRSRDDRSPVPPEQARIRFVHSLPDADRAQIVFGAEPVPGINRLTYQAVSRDILLNANQATRFSWSAEDGNDLETAEGVILEQGYSYLYLLTGADVDSTPVILAERVGIDESIFVEGVSEDPTPAPRPPATVRLVNMIEDRLPVDVLLDGQVFVSELPHAQITGALLFAAGTHTISARIPGTTVVPPDGEIEPVSPDDLVAIGFDFREDASYTLYFYGESRTQANVLVVENPPQQFSTPGQIANIRLVNLTAQSNVAFGLAIAEQSAGASPAPIDPTTEAEGGLPPFRETLYTPARSLFAEITSGSASPLTAVLADTYDIFVVDSLRALVAKTQFGQPLEADRTYDIVVAQLPGSSQVNLFIIVY